MDGMLAYHVYPLTLYPLPADPDHLASALFHLCARPRNKYPKHQQQSNHCDQPTNPRIHESIPSQAPVSKRIKPLYTTPPRIQEVENDHSQRLQTADPLPRRDRARDKREHCGTGGAEARDVADGARDELVGEDVPRVVDHDREDGPEEEADEGDAYCRGDERVDEPDDELEAAGRAGVSCRTKGGGRGRRGGGEKPGRIRTPGRGRCR